MTFVRTVACDSDGAILDEATASRDPCTERLIVEVLVRLIGRTIVIVATLHHSTEECVDRIVRKGKPSEIKESGGICVPVVLAGEALGG